MNRTLKFKPVVTEKSMRLAADGQFTLFVPRGVEKVEIARVIEAVYKVHVLSVNTVRRASKPKRRGTISGTTSQRVKAIVRLQQGEKIPGFELVGASADAEPETKTDAKTQVTVKEKK